MKTLFDDNEVRLIGGSRHGKTITMWKPQRFIELMTAMRPVVSLDPGGVEYRQPVFRVERYSVSLDANGNYVGVLTR